MKLLQSIIFFISASILHLGLLVLFTSDFYILYFVSLLISAYLLYRYYKHFSYISFFLLLALVLGLINLNIYDEYVFELLFYLDALDRTLYINGEVMYVLVTLHLLLLINLKKFENFWAIMDKKLFNRVWY